MLELIVEEAIASLMIRSNRPLVAKSSTIADLPHSIYRDVDRHDGILARVMKGLKLIERVQCSSGICARRGTE
jgi:hypothetical protein